MFVFVLLDVVDLIYYMYLLVLRQGVGGLLS